MADATQVQRRRGTQSQCEAGTPVEGEIWVDTTLDTLRVGDGSKAGGFLMPNAEHIQESTFNFASAVGADALSVTLFPVPDNPSTGFSFKFRAAENNTGSVTVSLNGASPIEIRKIQGSAIVPLEANDLIASGIYEVNHNGVYYLLNSPIPVVKNDVEFVGRFEPAGGSRYWDINNIFEENYSYDIEIYGLGISINATAIRPQLFFSSNGGSTWSGNVLNFNSQEVSNTSLSLCNFGSNPHTNPSSRISTKFSFINPASAGENRVHCCEYAASSVVDTAKIMQPFKVGNGTTSFNSLRIDSTGGSASINFGVANIWRKRSFNG